MQGSLSWNRQEVSRLNEKLENSVSKKWFYVVVSVAVVLFVMLLVLVWGNFKEHKQADLWGQLFCQTIAKRSDLIVQIGQSAPFGRVLFSCVGSHVSCLQDPSRTHIYEVKYSMLYFTWKLDRICAKILDKILRI